jgi:hypothetical protein
MSFANEPQPPLHADGPMPLVPSAKTLRKPRRSFWRRWLVRGLVAVLLIVGILVGAYACYHHRVAADLATYLAELDQQEPGWRLRDLEAARATIPDAENSALCVREAAAEIKKINDNRTAAAKAQEFEDFLKGNGLEDKEVPRPLDPAGFAESTPQYRLNAEQAATLNHELDELRLALEKTHRLADMPNGRFPITFKRFIISTDVSHSHDAVEVAALWKMAAMKQIEDGDINEATRSCRAALNAARSIGDEPTMIAHLSRNGAAKIACRGLERILNQGELTPDDLADLQRAFDAERRFPRLLVALRGERGEIHEMLDNVESDVVDERPPGSGQSTWWQSLLALPVRDTFRQHHPRLLQQMTRAVEIAQLPLPQRQAAMHILEKHLDHEFRKSLVYLVIPAMERIEESSRQLDARLGCLVTALAVERYRREHNGEWPKSLVRLVPELLPTLPLDPADGAELGYCRLPDRVVIYSRISKKGGNGDEVFDPDEPSQPGVGIAVHLYDVKYRHLAPELLPPPVPDDDPQ